METVMVVVSLLIAIASIVGWVKANGWKNFLIRSVDAMATTEGKDFADKVKASIKNRALEAGIEDSLNKVVKKVTTS